MANCPRCAAGLLPHATVCHACCALIGDADLEIAQDATVKPQDPLSSWPFGTADAQTVLAVSQQPRERNVMPELLQYAETLHAAGADLRLQTSLRQTFVMGGLPEQRDDEAEPAPPPPVESSVPPTGPNPFLAAARIQHALEGGDEVEAYSA